MNRKFAFIASIAMLLLFVFFPIVSDGKDVGSMLVIGLLSKGGSVVISSMVALNAVLILAAMTSLLVGCKKALKLLVVLTLLLPAYVFIKESDAGLSNPLGLIGYIVLNMIYIYLMFKVATNDIKEWKNVYYNYAPDGTKSFMINKPWLWTVSIALLLVLQVFIIVFAVIIGGVRLFRLDY